MSDLDTVVRGMLDRFDAAYRGRIADQVEDWEEIARPILEETWAEGYSAGRSDADKMYGRA